jgi:hypothetical protein
LKCREDVELFTSYQDRRKFMHFMMALHVDFEPIQASHLHRTPLPKLNAAVAELISKETRHSNMEMQSPNMVVAVAPQSAPKFPHVQSTAPSSFKKIICNYCKQVGHSTSNCYKLKNKN